MRRCLGRTSRRNSQVQPLTLHRRDNEIAEVEILFSACFAPPRFVFLVLPLAVCVGKIRVLS